MESHADKTRQNVQRPAAAGFAISGAGYMNRTPDALMQRKMQETANGGTQAGRLKDMHRLMNGPAPQPVQRSAGPLAGPDASAPIQMYTTAGGKKISANADYYVKDNADQILFVNDNAAIDSRGNQIVATGATETYSGNNYTAYHYYADDTGGFVNDCLGLAEQLAGSTKTASTRAEFRATGSGTNPEGKLFGHSDSQNVSIAKDSGWYGDEAANPGIGEAYAIAPTVLPGETGKKEAPYHVAAVVAKDATDNITLEADAGTVRSRPLFDMYDTQPSGTRTDAQSKTFHEVYASGFTYKRPKTIGPVRKRPRMESYAPSTGVLKPRTD